MESVVESVAESVVESKEVVAGEAHSRMYYQVTTGDGRSITPFQDRVTGAWSLQRG